jgi:hypothetical protein
MIWPVVAKVGTAVSISVGDTRVNAAAVPLNFTLLAPAMSDPRMVTEVPTSPEAGTALTNAFSPTDTLNTVPMPLAPPSSVVP